ncbi:hypothetical protein Tco_0347492, partial [Tanacetum coccineum]
MKDLLHSFRKSNACYHDPKQCEHAGPKVTTIHGGNTTTRMIKRFTVADDLKESSKITQVKGTKFKDHYTMHKEINARRIIDYELNTRSRLLSLIYWKDDGYCNGGNLLETYIIGNQLHYQDYEWYEALEDSKLKDEALRNKSIMEGFIKEDDDESRYEQKRRWNIYINNDDAYEINHEDYKSEELCEIHELSVCYVRRYMLIKYSFNNDEEYVAIKEDEYEDLTITRKEACQAYQEIFRIMDEGWMVTRA